MPLFIEQSLAIGSASGPAALAASRGDVVVAPFAAADAEPLYRVYRRSPDQGHFRQDRVSRCQVSGRQQVSPEIGIAADLPGDARGPVTRPVLRLMRLVAVKLAPAVAALQRGVFTAHRTHAATRSGFHGRLIPPRVY